MAFFNTSNFFPKVNKNDKYGRSVLEYCPDVSSVRANEDF